MFASIKAASSNCSAFAPNLLPLNSVVSPCSGLTGLTSLKPSANNNHHSSNSSSSRLLKTIMYSIHKYSWYWIPYFIHFATQGLETVKRCLTLRHTLYHLSHTKLSLLPFCLLPLPCTSAIHLTLSIQLWPLTNESNSSLHCKRLRLLTKPL